MQRLLKVIDKKLNRILMKILNNIKNRVVLLTYSKIPVIFACTIIILVGMINLVACNSFGTVSNIIGQEKVQQASSILPTPLQTKEEPKDVIVVVDPGHGGDDWGTYWGDIFEKKINLDISLKLGKLLKDNGIEVVYTRIKDENIELKQRAKIANDINANLFVSVHNNKMPENDNYRGTETLFTVDPNAKDSKFDGQEFAKIVQSELVKSLKLIDNGIIYRPNLAVLHRTKMPAVIAEIGYISNYQDRAKLSQDSFRMKAAKALCSSVVKALPKMGAKVSDSGKWVLVPK